MKRIFFLYNNDNRTREYQFDPATQGKPNGRVANFSVSHIQSLVSINSFFRILCRL